MSYNILGADTFAGFILVLLGIGLLLGGIRLLRGPTLPDRIIAFDLIAVLVMGMVSTVAIVTDQWILLDAVIILGLLAFLATAAFAHFLTTNVDWQRRWPR